MNLIKKHRPRYNISLKDDKSYPYVKVTVQEEFPRVFVTRRLLKDGARYFGPYTSAKNYVKGPVLLDSGWGLGPGGGVCQVSSTLYNVLAQLPGVNVIHHISHGSNGIAYLPLNMDAAVGNAAHAIDLIFRNEYDFDLRFEALAQNGALFIALYRVTEGS